MLRPHLHPKPQRCLLVEENEAGSPAAQHRQGGVVEGAGFTVSGSLGISSSPGKLSMEPQMSSLTSQFNYLGRLCVQLEEIGL